MLPPNQCDWESFWLELWIIEFGWLLKLLVRTPTRRNLNQKNLHWPQQWVHSVQNEVDQLGADEDTHQQSDGSWTKEKIQIHLKWKWKRGEGFFCVLLESLKIGRCWTQHWKTEIGSINLYFSFEFIYTQIIRRNCIYLKLEYKKIFRSLSIRWITSINVCR